MDSIERRVESDALNISRGAIPGYSIVNKFGRNSAVGTTEVVITRTNAAYTGFLTTAAPLRIKAGGNAADTAAGVGAQSVLFSGLDASFNAVSETVVTAGASASSPTSASFIRMFRSYVVDAGAYSNGMSGANTGDITIETTGGVTVGLLAATFGQSQLGVYTIPAGKTGYLLNFATTVSGSKTATVRLYQRRSADDVTTPFSSKRVIHVFPELQGQAIKKFEVYPSLPAKTDIFVTGIKDATGTTSVSATFDIILVDD